jgi:glycerophosphoryl diester phosphodiesterase
MAERRVGALRRPFDVQAHRGGRGLATESTLAAFATALELGVTTLELDVRLTEDGRPLVTHERRISPIQCRDTAAAAPGDPEFPYVGDLIWRLSLEQVATLDCGWQRLPGFAHQRVVAGARIPQLSEVFALVDCYGAHDVRFNIDTKFAADAPAETAPRRQLVRVVAHEVRQAHVLHRATIVGLDWGVLMEMRRVEPRLPIVAASSPRFLQAGEPGKSPWLGGLDVDDFRTGLVGAAAAFGADAIAPVHGSPAHPGTGLPRYPAFTTRKMIRRAHRSGLEVIPWTVNRRATMRHLIEAGVDGIITDYPNRLRAVIALTGLRAPSPMPGKRRCVRQDRTTGGRASRRSSRARPRDPPYRSRGDSPR